VYINPIQINWWRKFIFIVKLVVDKKKRVLLDWRKNENRRRRRRWVSYKKQELLTLREHLGSSPIFKVWSPCCSSF
jgi:hypothetical protein